MPLPTKINKTPPQFVTQVLNQSSLRFSLCSEETCLAFTKLMLVFLAVPICSKAQCSVLSLQFTGLYVLAFETSADTILTKAERKAIYNRLAHIHFPLVDLYSSILCLEEVPIVKCNKSWSSEKLSISINISTEWLAKIHFDIWEYKFYEKDCRCSARN